MKKLLVLMVIGAAVHFVFKENQIPFINNIFNPVQSSELKADCKIKGNVSINSGRKIYHVPGQKDYQNTRIKPEYGERYFCSEEEAKQAGWVKAPR